MHQRETLTRRLLPFLLGMAVPLLADGPSSFDLPPTLSLDAPSPTGITAVQNLIALTEANLAEQRHLETLLSEYKEVEQRYARNPDSEELVFELVGKAATILRIVEDQHLTHLFDEQMLSELSLFAKIANRQSASL